jgi:uncharacterized protein (TIGR02118 family)
MHSIVFVFNRHPELTSEQFYEHYEHVHGLIARKLPGLLEYRQHPARTSGQGDGFYAGKQNKFDAVSVYTFESAEAAEAAWVSEVGIQLDEDTKYFLDLETMITLPATIRTVFPDRD